MKTRYLVLAPNAGDLAVVAPALRALRTDGGTVHLVHASGTIGRELRALKSRHRLQPQPVRKPTTRQRIRAALNRRSGDGVDELDDFGELVRSDPEVAALAAASDVLLPIGGDRVNDAADVTMRTNAHLYLMSVDELDAIHQEFLLGRLLGKIGDNPRRGLTDELTGKIMDALARLERVAERFCDDLIRVVAGLHAQGNHEAAWEVVSVVRDRGPQLAPPVAAEFSALSTAVELSARARTEQDVAAVVEEVLTVADEALAHGDLDAAAHRLFLALSVLFHRELHADVLSSPLIDDPDTFLAPLRASHIHAVLRRPVPPGDREFDRRRAQDAVLVLPGSYGRFSRAVVDAVGDQIDATVLDMGSRSHFMGMGTHEYTLRARLGQAVGAAVTPDYELLEAMEAADVVFADWADRGAVWTTMLLPEGARMVLRVHSMDALSSWIHVLDWSRVNDLIFVSPHVRDIVLAQVGPYVDGTRVHVIPNVVDVARFDGADRAVAVPRTLALVGWAQKVKDPLWALEVLARLRSEDPRWRLQLIGTDFTVGSVHSSHEYVDTFLRRLADDDVVGAVDFVDFTDDLPSVLSSVDFILSSSLRESFGVGLVEGAAAGAVPVVRDWPMFRDHGGPYTLFPPEWIVADVDAAVSRIDAVSEPDAWVAASSRAQEVVAERFDVGQVAQRYRDVLVGRDW
ncbi:MAG: glycosyltransferase family 4 protein [Nocardioidaceae bacterium]|nr:glycosyltransferase family 4 protein [Nocardioidaceae bacterium]